MITFILFVLLIASIFLGIGAYLQGEELEKLIEIQSERLSVLERNMDHLKKYLGVKLVYKGEQYEVEKIKRPRRKG